MRSAQPIWPRFFGRVRTVALALIAAGAWSVAHPASASAEVAFDCALDGRITADVRIQGGTGTYRFDEHKAACLAGEAGTGSEVAVVTLDITSNGTFTNTICGTGQFADDNYPSPPSVDVDVVASSDASGAIESALEGADWTYAIDSFAAGVFNFLNSGSGTAVTGGGLVTVSPDPTRPPTSEPLCTTALYVAGSIAGVIG